MCVCVYLLTIAHYVGADSAVVSGWRLIDGSPYWAPKLGQEELLKKVRVVM